MNLWLQGSFKKYQKRGRKEVTTISSKVFTELLFHRVEVPIGDYFRKAQKAYMLETRACFIIYFIFIGFTSEARGSG